MNVTEQYSFDEYFSVVLDNVSKRTLTEELRVLTKEELYEMVYDLYFLDVQPTKAVVLLESFYSKFRKFLN